jgi:hypothetical protein
MRWLGFYNRTFHVGTVMKTIKREPWGASWMFTVYDVDESIVIRTIDFKTALYYLNKGRT